VSETARRTARAQWTTEVFHGADDTADLDTRYWLGLTIEARVEAAWRLSLEQWALLDPEILARPG
jgi:hypothetical protein